MNSDTSEASSQCKEISMILTTQFGYVCEKKFLSQLFVKKLKDYIKHCKKSLR